MKLTCQVTFGTLHGDRIGGKVYHDKLLLSSRGIDVGKNDRFQTGTFRGVGTRSSSRNPLKGTESLRKRISRSCRAVSKGGQSWFEIGRESERATVRVGDIFLGHHPNQKRPRTKCHRVCNHVYFSEGAIGVGEKDLEARKYRSQYCSQEVGIDKGVASPAELEKGKILKSSTLKVVSKADRIVRRKTSEDREELEGNKGILVKPVALGVGAKHRQGSLQKGACGPKAYQFKFFARKPALQSTFRARFPYLCQVVPGNKQFQQPEEVDALETSFNPVLQKSVDRISKKEREQRKESRSSVWEKADNVGTMGDTEVRDEALKGKSRVLKSVKRVAKARGMRFGGILEGQLQPELLAISLVYLVQGLLGLSRLAVFTFFKDDLGLSPATVGILTGLTAAPWVIKPLYGFLSDSVPLFGYRRRSYLVLCGVLGALSWTAMGLAVASPQSAVFALILGSMSTACADVVADSIVVELSRGESQSMAGSLQSLCWSSASAGGIMSAYFSGSLVQDYGPRFVFLLTAAFPVLVAGAAVAIPEDPTQLSSSNLPQVLNEEALPSPTDSDELDSDNPSVRKDRRESASLVLRQKTRSAVSEPVALDAPLAQNSVLTSMKEQVIMLKNAITQKSIFLPTIFVFCWQATPSPDTAMLFFETNQLGFTTEFLGRIRLIASIASLIGVGVYNFGLKKVPLRKMFFWTAILGAGLGLTQLALITGFNRQLGLSDELFALGDSAILTVLGQVSFMPVLVLAARLCPEGVEATLFATLMSLLNGGSFVGSAFGSILTEWFGVTATDFDGLVPLVTLCTLCTLAPLPLLRLLPETMDRETVETEEVTKKI